jgi:hypothetical protein
MTPLAPLELPLPPIDIRADAAGREPMGGVAGRGAIPPA